MLKSARPLLVAALLAVVGACAPTKQEPAVTPVAALPEAPPPPMMVPSIAPLPAPRVAHSAPKRLSAVKKHRHVTEHKVAAKTGKHTAVAKHSKKKKSHHNKVAKASHRHAPGATKLASRVKPAPASVPLDSPAPVMAPSPLTPGLR